MRRRWQSMRWRLLRAFDRLAGPLTLLILLGLLALAAWLLYEGYLAFWRFWVEEPLA